MARWIFCRSYVFINEFPTKLCNILGGASNSQDFFTQISLSAPGKLVFVRHVADSEFLSFQVSPCCHFGRLRMRNKTVGDSVQSDNALPRNANSCAITLQAFPKWHAYSGNDQQLQKTVERMYFQIFSIKVRDCLRKSSS